MNKNQITCNNLSLGYGSKVILKELSFDINERDYLLIIGENGTGKSTLIKTLLGLQQPISGEIKLEIPANDIGYLPQQTEISKDFPATVYEVVLSGCLNKMGLRPFYNAKEKQEAIHNMEKVRILDLKNQSFMNLSGGQKQRVLLARALCASSKLLILDEPVSGLDPETTKDLYQLIQELNKEITVIMISHDIHYALKYASKILKLGINSFYGTNEEYINISTNNASKENANSVFPTKEVRDNE